jgi:GT2 family glycosyltransferase
MNVSVVIPTYRRERVLLDTLQHLLRLESPPDEILVVDQSEEHQQATSEALKAWNSEGRIRWIRLPQPSITHAMNSGLKLARGDVVIFLDDDIIPGQRLVSAHALAQAEGSCNIVAGQVLQPGEEVLCEPYEAADFLFRSGKRRWIEEMMGGNFSVKRTLAIDLGGFDENFVHAAYRFEAEFCDRALSAGERILFEPRASIRHLKAIEGGTRAYGHHLTTVKPSHAVGAYYYLLRARRVSHRFGRILWRPLRSIRTRHHLRHPWWIPGTLLAEFWGFLWALRLYLRGPRLIRPEHR